MDKESGESMEPMEELKCHSKNWVSQDLTDWCVVVGETPGVDYRDEGKHAGRNDLLFIAIFFFSPGLTPRTPRAVTDRPTSQHIRFYFCYFFFLSSFYFLVRYDRLS